MSGQEEFEIHNPSSRFDHFANIAILAFKRNGITEAEQAMREKMARKLDIPEVNNEQVFKNPKAYPVSDKHGKEQLLEYLLKMIYNDAKSVEVEQLIIKHFAIGLGNQLDQAKKINQKSIRLFSSRFFDDYQYFTENT